MIRNIVTIALLGTVLAACAHAEATYIRDAQGREHTAVSMNVEGCGSSTSAVILLDPHGKPAGGAGGTAAGPCHAFANLAGSAIGVRGGNSGVNSYISFDGSVVGSSASAKAEGTGYGGNATATQKGVIKGGDITVAVKNAQQPAKKK